MHPLSYFASAPDGTNDALILRDIEDQIGSEAENLTSEDKLAFLAVLSRYLYFKQCVVPGYEIGQAIADTQIFADTTPDTLAAIRDTAPDPEEIWDILLTLEGISLENALGLLQFITVTAQQSSEAGRPAAKTCFNCTPDQLVLADSESASVIDPGCAWLLLLPKDGFTMPKFSFGQSVQSRSRETIGRIIGMEFAPSGCSLAYQISPGWHYLIAVTEHPNSLNWRDEVDAVPEADLIIACGGED